MQVSDLNFLVVEDNDFQRHWLKVMLSNVGATKIYQASDGHEALKILRDADSAIDISFIDLNLPGMDGMELIRHMSKQERSPSIVLASALAPSLIFSVETMSKAYGVNLLGSWIRPCTTGHGFTLRLMILSYGEIRVVSDISARYGDAARCNARRRWPDCAPPSRHRAWA